MDDGVLSSQIQLVIGDGKQCVCAHVGCMLFGRGWELGTGKMVLSCCDPAAYHPVQ